MPLSSNTNYFFDVKVTLYLGKSPVQFVSTQDYTYDLSLGNTNFALQKTSQMASVLIG